jgi:hypothetical protein
MAKQKRSRQTWLPVYAMALIMVGLLFLAHQMAPSPGWRHFLEVSVLVIGYSSIWLWLEKHTGLLLDRPSAEADSPAIKSSQMELPPALPSRGRIYFYVCNDPAIIYGGSEASPSNLRLNGHHRVTKTTPSLPEETAE